jgi:hypothetical protein
MRACYRFCPLATKAESVWLTQSPVLQESSRLNVCLYLTPGFAQNNRASGSHTPLPTQMDTLRTDLLLKYILAAAGEEERGLRELGPIHLLKYAYIGDLAHAERHAGSTFTQAAWRFYHFGPWAEEVHGRIDPIVEQLGAVRRTIVSSKFERDSVRYSFSDERTLDSARRPNSF